MTFLSRHISVADLLRVPTLKEKMKTDSEKKLKTANALLFLYPVMMAAENIVNILIYKLTKIKHNLVY